MSRHSKKDEKKPTLGRVGLKWVILAGAAMSAVATTRHAASGSGGMMSRAGAGRAHSWRSMASRATGAYCRNIMVGARACAYHRGAWCRCMAGTHSWAGMGAVRWDRPNCWSVGRGRCYVPHYRMVMRRRYGAIHRRVMPVRREQEWGQYGDDIGRGIVRANAHASGIDAIGCHGNTAADSSRRYGDRIIGGATGKSSAEQGGTEQGGKALHGWLLAGSMISKTSCHHSLKLINDAQGKAS